MFLGTKCKTVYRGKTGPPPQIERDSGLKTQRFHVRGVIVGYRQDTGPSIACIGTHLVPVLNRGYYSLHSTMSANGDAPSLGGSAGRPPRSDSVGNEGEAAQSSSSEPSSQQAERSGSMSHASVFDRPPPSSVSAADRGLSNATGASGANQVAPASDLYSSWLGESASTGVGVGVGVGVGIGGHMSLSGLDLGPPSAIASSSGAPPTHRRSGSNASSASGRGSGGIGTGVAWASVGATASATTAAASASGISAAPALSGTGGHRRSSSDTDGTSFAKPGSLLGSNRSASVPSASVAELMNDPKAVTSIIHDAARITNWTRVHSLSLSHPASARYSGPDRWTALHHCCSRRCPHAYVVEALFRAYPAALLCLDEKQWTPLHHAARFKAPRDVVQLLLKDHPDMGRTAASKRCSKGRSPLFYAIRYDAPDGVVELLLEANPEAVLEPDRDGVTPLALVWDRYVTSFEGRRAIQPYVAKLHAFLDAHHAQHSEKKDGGEGKEDTVGEGGKVEEVRLDGNITIGNSKLRGKWEKANMLLRAAFGFPVVEEREESAEKQQEDEDDGDEDEIDEWEQVSVPQDAPPADTAEADSKRRKRKWRILHAASTVRCHPTLFQLACVMHPEQAVELDENDLYYNDNDDDVVLVDSTTDGVGSEQPKKRITTALHLAAASPAHGKDGKTILTTLLAMNPSAASVVDGITGSLPLHIAVENERKIHCIYDGIATLFEANPAAIEAKDRRGRTPLHRACSAIGHRPATGIMVAVVPGTSLPQNDPSAANNDGNVNAGDGSTTTVTAEPTATAVTATTAPQGVTAAGLGSIIQNLVTIYIEAASIADDSGRLPLHVIAKYGEGWTDDAEAVLKAYPGAAQVRAGRSRQGAAHARLPIHIAATGPDAGPDLISRLVAAHPRGVSLPDGFGKLPLHLACESGKVWEEGVRVLYESYPRAVEEKEDNGRGWTALHMAASCPHSSHSLIEALVDIYPAATFEVDRRGQFPLHLACASGKSWEGGIKIIFDANPEAAGAPNSVGLLPFHCAALAYSVSSSGGLASSSKMAPSRSHSSTSPSSDDSIVTTHHEHEPSPDIGEAVHVHGNDSQDLLAKINVVYCLLREVPAVL